MGDGELQIKKGVIGLLVLAPTGTDSIAQGIALGWCHRKVDQPQRGVTRMAVVQVAPLQG